MKEQRGAAWKAGCVTTSKVKVQGERPYLGRAKHGTDTHVQVYWKTIIEQCEWATRHAYIRIGDAIVRQVTIPQGEHGSPFVAQCVSVMHIDLKFLRLQHLSKNDPSEFLRARASRVTTLLCETTAMLMDDIASLIPYFLDDHDSEMDAMYALGEIYNATPTVSGMPTFPPPLELAKQLDGE